MTTINNDFYCSAGMYDDNNSCCAFPGFWKSECKSPCQSRHRKHPTPEQYKEEYGEEYHDDWAVYIQLKDHTGWLTTVKRQIKESSTDGSNSFFYWSGYKTVIAVVCACTPYGKPDDTWRPE